MLRPAAGGRSMEAGQPIDIVPIGTPVPTQGGAGIVVVPEPQPFSEEDFGNQISVEFWTLQSEQLRLAYRPQLRGSWVSSKQFPWRHSPEPENNARTAS